VAAAVKLAAIVFVAVLVLLFGLEGSRVVFTNDEGIILEAAQRMVRLAEPFPPLPDTPDHVDILHVTRTWVFVPGGTMRTE